MPQLVQITFSTIHISISTMKLVNTDIHISQIYYAHILIPESDNVTVPKKINHEQIHQKSTSQIHQS